MSIIKKIFSFISDNGQEDTQQIVPVPERPLYVVGDIHGCANLLERLLARIIEDCQRNPPGSTGTEIVFLGDYVDRGDQSAEVLKLLIALADTSELSIQFLKGNHEAMMLDFIEDPDAAASWLRYGGLSTLMSYGIRGVSETADAKSRARVSEELREALGTHLKFLEHSLKPLFCSGNVICVHAAFDPSLPLHAQRERTLLWGQDGFLREGGPPDRLIVHGHTVSPEPDFGRNRLGIDTGAYFSGRLTAVRMDSGKLQFITS